MTNETILETSIAAIRFDNIVEIMRRAIPGKKKRKSAPIGSEGLGIKPSKGEICASGTSRVVVSPVTSREPATLVIPPGIISPEVLGLST